MPSSAVGRNGCAVSSMVSRAAACDERLAGVEVAGRLVQAHAVRRLFLDHQEAAVALDDGCDGHARFPGAGHDGGQRQRARPGSADARRLSRKVAILLTPDPPSRTGRARRAHAKHKSEREQLHEDRSARRSSPGRNPRGRLAGDRQETGRRQAHGRSSSRAPACRPASRTRPTPPRARRIGSAADALGADLVLKVRTPVEQEFALMKRGARAGRHARAVQQRRHRGHERGRPDGVRARSRAAHDARAEHGRAVVAGQHRRLQGGAAGRHGLRPPDADDDDGRRAR